MMKYSLLTFSSVALLAGQAVGGLITFTDARSIFTTISAGAPWITLPQW